MNKSKLDKIKHAKDLLINNNIKFDTYNNDIHFKIGSINFYPTTGKWFDETNTNKGFGIEPLISLLSRPGQEITEGSVIVNRLTVDQIFDIAKKSTCKRQTLYEMCEEIHRGIYEKK